MKDVVCAEPREKLYIRFFRFLYFELQLFLVIFFTRNCQFTMNFHDNSKFKNRKIDFSFDSANCVCISLFGTGSIKFIDNNIWLIQSYCYPSNCGARVGLVPLRPAWYRRSESSIDDQISYPHFLSHNSLQEAFFEWFRC